MVKVSVIVPVYNVYDYLPKCLDSLVKQTLKDIEIIVVNDGSPDKSQDIIDEYSKKYKIIKAYKKENGGLSDARNYGIERARGEYITFIDSDDYVDMHMLEEMYNKAKSNNYDIVCCDLEYVYPDSDRKLYVKSLAKDNMDIKEAMINLYPAAWNKIYKKELFDNKNIRFKKGVWFEDVEFMYKLLPFVKSIGVINKPFNKYLQRNGSISKSIDKRIYHYIDNFNGLIDYYKKMNIYDTYFNELEYSYVRYIYATFIKSCKKYNYSEYLKAVDTAIKNVKDNFLKYKKNKYFYKSLKGIYLLIFNKMIAKIYYKI